MRCDSLRRKYIFASGKLNFLSFVSKVIVNKLFKGHGMEREHGKRTRSMGKWAWGPKNEAMDMKQRIWGNGCVVIGID